MSTLNINKLIDGRRSCLEDFYFKNKNQASFEVDITQVLNQKISKIKNNHVKVSTNSGTPPGIDEEIIFNMFLDEILGNCGIWFFSPTESIYQISSFSLLEDMKIPKAIFMKSDKFKIQIISSDKKINLRYKLMMESFKSDQIDGSPEVLSKAYIIEKLPLSYVFKDVKLKGTVELNHTDRITFENQNFNIEDLESKILLNKEEYKESLKVYFPYAKDYDTNYKTYLKTLVLSSINFKTDDVYRMFLKTIYLKKELDALNLDAFHKLDKTVLALFSSHFDT